MDTLTIALISIIGALVIILILCIIKISTQRKNSDRGNERAMRYLKLTNASSRDDPALIRLDKQIVLAKTMADARLVRGDFGSVAEKLEV